MPGDLPEHVDWDTGIGHPGKAGVAQVVTAQMLVAELGDDLVPVGRGMTESPYTADVMVAVSGSIPAWQPGE
jgi:hypothetical protein